MKRVKIIGNWLMVVGALLVSTPAMAQIVSASHQEEQQAFGATAPGAAFQSTSAMSGSGSDYSPNPSLNADGTATYDGASYTPAKAPRPGSMRRGWGDNEENPTPLGDAVVPLMLLSCAYVCARSLKKKRA